MDLLSQQSADPDVVATALRRGAFEYQGQNAQQLPALISRRILQRSKKKLTDGISSFKIGSVEDYNFINAVIDEKLIKLENL